jgi:hypothetical protein
MTACAEGRSTVIGTRRSRSHGEATLAVSAARTKTCHMGASRCTVNAQKSPIAVQPANRCELSKTLWARRLTGGIAQATTSSISATRP